MKNLLMRYHNNGLRLKNHLLLSSNVNNQIDEYGGSIQNLSLSSSIPQKTWEAFRSGLAGTVILGNRVTIILRYSEGKKRTDTAYFILLCSTSAVYALLRPGLLFVSTKGNGVAMKTLSFLMILLVNAGCVRTSQLRVESDYTTQTLPATYASFAFATPAVDTEDTTRLGNVLRAAITAQLIYRGYRYNPRQPDLLVAFMIYRGRVIMRGLDQPDLLPGETWFNQSDKDLVKSSQHLFPDGALLIQFIDLRTSHMVWRGYASGFGNIPDAVQHRHIKWYVRQILDRYPLLAPDYLLSRGQ